MDALRKIGVAPTFAQFPGMSLIRGRVGLWQITARENSFLPAPPIFIAVALIELIKNLHRVQAVQIPMRVVGYVMPMVIALTATKKFCRFVTRLNFASSPAFRIGPGLLVRA